MNYPFSLYIPRMSVKHDKDSISGYLEMLNIGVVSRVDFTPINKKPGFKEDIGSNTKSAFVHFSNVPQGYFGKGFPYDVHFWSEIYSGKSFKLQVSENEYWLCLKNNKPIQKTLMNIHQVVENGRHLENLVEEQAKKIQEQQEIIEKLSNKLEGVQGVVYQLLGGLFNGTQGEILDEHLSILLGRQIRTKQLGRQIRTKVTYEEQNENKWDNWPTTRQGDDCERRIEILEKMLGVDSEVQDTELLERKYRRPAFDDTEVEKQLKIDEELREEDRYNEMLQEAAVDKAIAEDDYPW